jgi:hypothetical protein
MRKLIAALAVGAALAGCGPGVMNTAGKEVTHPQQPKTLQSTSWTELQSQPVPTPISEPQRILWDRIIKHKKTIPEDYGLMSNATAEDYTFIRAVLTHKEYDYYWGHAIRALGFMGTEEAANDLLAMLSEQGSPYTGCADTIIQSLGFAAHTRDKAYEVLKQGCDFNFWKARMKSWQMSEDSSLGKEASIATDIAIQSIGWTGRPDSKAFLYGLAKQNQYRKSAVICGMAYADMVAENGFEKFKHQIYFPSLEQYRSWKAKHPEWSQWADGVGPLPPLNPQPQPPAVPQAPIPEPTAVP